MYANCIEAEALTDKLAQTEALVLSTLHSSNSTQSYAFLVLQIFPYNGEFTSAILDFVLDEFYFNSYKEQVTGLTHRLKSDVEKKLNKQSRKELFHFSSVS